SARHERERDVAKFVNESALLQNSCVCTDRTRLATVGGPACAARTPSPAAQDDALILYEYPLNERVRMLLRLEDLFDRLEFVARREHPLDHHVARGTLFVVLDVAGRADLKSDLLQELER